MLAVPPKFAPFAESLTTLYDTAIDAWDKRQHGGKVPERPVSFTRDIYPILRRLSGITWLNRTAFQHHGANTNYNFGNVHGPLFLLLASNAKDGDAPPARRHLWSRLRPPGLVAETPEAADTRQSLTYANYGYMPQMSGDGGEPVTPDDPVSPPGVQDQVFDCATGEQ